MANLLTRPYFRDSIRRLLQIRPPIDTNTGLPGATPGDRPYPTNPQINDNLQFALSDINNACGTHSTQIAVTVSGQSPTSLGPLGVYLGDLTYPGQANASVAPVGLIDTIQRALWQDSTNDITLLAATDSRALDRQGNTYFSNVPSVPAFFYIEGYVLQLFPAPASTGTLILTCGTGYVGLQSETDVLDQFPIDFQPILIYQTIARLSKLMTMDTEAAQRAANFLPDAERGMAQIAAWKKGLSGVSQPSLVPETYRNTYGTQRMRR